MIMSKSEKTVSYTPFTRSEKLVPSILTALAIPFTLFFFGPFEACCSNIEEFGFVFADFAWLSLLSAIVASAAIFAILWYLPGRVFDIAYAILFAVAFLLYLQGNYLNLGLDAVSGDGVGKSTYSVAETVINTIVWVMLFASAITAVVMIRKKREIMRLVTIVALIAVIGVQVMIFGVMSITTDVWVPMEDRMQDAASDEDGDADGKEDEFLPSILTNSGLTEASTSGNIIWFVVDRFDMNYAESVLKDDPDFYATLDGFTLFDNHISKYARTYPSIAYMLTGVEQDYEQGRIAYFQKAYSEGTFLKDLDNSGYKVNLYTCKFYSYEDGEVFEDYAANLSSSSRYQVIDRLGLFGDMLRLTLFRYLPIAAKGTVGVLSSGDFGEYVEYEANRPMFDTDTRQVYNWLTSEGLTATVDGEKNFNFIHIDGTHLPNKYYEDLSVIPEDDYDRWNEKIAVRASFTLINYYLDELRRLGLYDDATIVISGDHAAAISDTDDVKGARVTALFVKPKGAHGTPLVRNHAPVEQSQIRATIMQSEGIVTENNYGTSVFDVPEDADLKRYYHFQKTVKNASDQLVIYEVVGNARDFKNWTLVDRIEIGELYK